MRAEPPRSLRLQLPRALLDPQQGDLACGDADGLLPVQLELEGGRVAAIRPLASAEGLPLALTPPVDVPLASIAGGTDLVGCLVLGNLYSNVYMGEIQGQSLGIDVDVFTDEGESVKDGEKGELVVKKPFPSMPVKFWGDDDGQKYHKAYFNRFKNIWHHGDFIERTLNNGFIMRGRSDATLNPGGVRIGTAEIYQQVEDIDFITEGLVVGQDYKDDVRIILFITTKNNEELNDEKIKSIKSKIRKNCSPKHVPSIIIKVPEIPRTKSGKIVELAVRKVIHGETINNKEAIANPEALKYFENIPQLK